LTAGNVLLLRLLATGKKSSSKRPEKNGLKLLLIVGNIALSSIIFN
jgi:hypothetical protein